MPYGPALDTPAGLAVEAWADDDSGSRGRRVVAESWHQAGTLDAPAVEVYDASSTSGMDTRGYIGGVSDGRYIDFAPHGVVTGGPGVGQYHGRVLRHDSQAELSDPDAWTAFDAGLVGGLVTAGTFGATFDGRYVYFAPLNSAIGITANVMRYDTQAPFDDLESWEVYNASWALATGSEGYVGLVFDGRYIVFTPLYNGGFYHGRVIRYDTLGPFTSAASWSGYDAGFTDGLATVGYTGSVFDGRHIYFVPWGETWIYHGHVLRLDTHGTFTDPSAWSAYNATTTEGLWCVRYAGGALDGRYVYFAPRGQSAGPHGRVLRLDTWADFYRASAWSAYDASLAGGVPTTGYSGASFDGRYINFIPFSDAFHTVAQVETSYHGRMLRFDTQGGFHDPGSWHALDLTAAAGPEAVGYTGGVFDGRYLYLSPFFTLAGAHGLVARVDLAPPDASWSLLTGLGDQGGGFSGGPPGPVAMLETDGVHRVAAAGVLEPDWHHMAMSWNGQDLDLWLDGQLAASTPAPGQLSGGGNPLTLGSQSFQGRIDEVALWSPPIDPAFWPARVGAYPFAPATVTAKVPVAAPSDGTVKHWATFEPTATIPPGTSILYQLSIDEGQSWLWWDGTAWTETQADPAEPAEANDVGEVQASIPQLDKASGTLQVRAILATTTEAYTPTLDHLAIGFDFVPAQ